MCVLPWYYQAKAKFQKGLYLEAAEECRAALQTDPRHQPTLTLQAKCEDMEVRLKGWKVPRPPGPSEGDPLHPHPTPRRRGQESLIPCVDVAGTTASSMTAAPKNVTDFLASTTGSIQTDASRRSRVHFADAVVQEAREKSQVIVQNVAQKQLQRASMEETARVIRDAFS